MSYQHYLFISFHSIRSWDYTKDTTACSHKIRSLLSWCKWHTRRAPMSCDDSIRGLSDEPRSEGVNHEKSTEMLTIEEIGDKQYSRVKLSLRFPFQTRPSSNNCHRSVCTLLNTASVRDHQFYFIIVRSRRFRPAQWSRVFVCGFYVDFIGGGATKKINEFCLPRRKTLLHEGTEHLEWWFCGVFCEWQSKSSGVSQSWMRVTIIGGWMKKAAEGYAWTGETSAF